MATITFNNKTKMLSEEIANIPSIDLGQNLSLGWVVVAFQLSIFNLESVTPEYKVTNRRFFYMH